MKIKYNEQTKLWEELEHNSPEGIYIDKQLMLRLEKIEQIRKKGWDCIILIDGVRRGGKSTLALTIAKILNPNLTIANVGRGTADSAEKIKNLPDGSILVIDEGSLVFNTKDALNREQKWLMKIIDVVGQKRLVLIVVLPSFFDLNRQIAITHSRFLLHIYTNEKLERGQFAYFGEDKKKILYTLGKKNWGSYSEPTADFVGSFVDYNPLGQEYIELKKKTMLEALEEPDTIRGGEYTRVVSQRNALIHYLIKDKGFMNLDVLNILKRYNIKMYPSNISEILKNFQNFKS